jgi:MFS family permease
MNERNNGMPAVKVLLSSLVGTTLEWYEFFVYGIAAALVFNKVFFPSFDPLVGTLLSLSTFAVAFIARPIGGVICGHFGDRIGRKRMLILTLTVMGVTTFAIGVLPGHATIGVAAPILLVTLRFIQGLSLGGEYSGAVLMSVEHAAPGKRGLYGAVINTGASWGMLLGNGVFLLLSSLSDSAFAQWGWRIPFLLSAILVFVGMYMRLHIEESPAFAQLQRTDEVRKMPILEVLRDHRRTVLAMAFSYMINGTFFYTATVFSLTYGQNHLGLHRSHVLWMVMLVTVGAIVGTLYVGWISDRVNRKVLYLFGIAGLTVTPIAWFALFSTGSTPWMLLGFVIVYIPYCFNYGAMPTFFAYCFPTDVRYSGMGLGYTLGTVIGSATAPIVCTYLLERTGDWPAIAGYIAAVGVVSFVATLLLKEQKWTAVDAGGSDSRDSSRLAFR